MTSGVSYETDVRPWLGARTAFALLSDSGGHGRIRRRPDQTNTRRPAPPSTNTALRPTRRPRDTITSGSYKGVTYADDMTSSAVAGVVGQFVVLANDTAAFDATVDVQQGGNSLAAVGSYQRSSRAALTARPGRPTCRSSGSCSA